ncbi:hypothetical protein VKT23_012126 [Stygiomarasmius scandens]|uniref:Uncharacterized protein n=1 Tax=Marasmiellus scandens TaxID=2682957 RepID=A0ABR1J7H0_9AGAR
MILLSCLRRFRQYTTSNCPFRVRPTSMNRRAPALLAGLLIGRALKVPVYELPMLSILYSKPLPNNFSRQSGPIQSFIYQLECGFPRTFVAYPHHFLGTDAAYSAHPMTAVLIVGDS